MKYLLQNAAVWLYWICLLLIGGWATVVVIIASAIVLGTLHLYLFVDTKRNQS